MPKVNSPMGPGTGAGEAGVRSQRLAQQLRANLQKRKALIRQRSFASDSQQEGDRPGRANDDTGSQG